jgi:hypothetical protein
VRTDKDRRRGLEREKQLYRLIVTTNNRIYAVEYSPAKRSWRFETLWSRFGMFFGCDWNDDHIYVAGRDSPHVGGKYGEVVLRFDRNLSFVDVWYRSRQVLDTHQICLVEDNLWIANTFHNGIRIVNIHTRIEQDYFPYNNGSVPGSFDIADKNHFNTIRYDGKLVYVIANNSVVRSGLRKRRSRSRILAIDPKTTRIRKSTAVRGHAAHDLWIEDDVFKTCDSARGVICGPNSASYLKLDTWLRGVAIADRIMFFGKTCWSPREQRSLGNGEIIAVDRRSQKILARTEIEGSGGVSDMFLLNHRDLARFHKKPFLEQRL